MVSRNFGWIGNLEGDKKEIDVEFPDKIDTGVLIGIGLVGFGVIILHPRSAVKYIISCALVGTGMALALQETFYRGAHQFNKAETKAHIELGNLEGPIEDYIFD